MPKITIEGKEIEISRELYETLKKACPQEGRFVPEKDELYWIVSGSCESINCSWDNCSTDNYRLNSGNCFRTEKEAIKHRDKLLAIAEVTKYCYEKDYVLDCDWKDTRQNKYFIGYNHDIKMPYTGVWVYTELAIVLPYLKSKEACQDVIEVKKAELELIFGIE